jgi:hypothetical protein
LPIDLDYEIAEDEAIEALAREDMRDLADVTHDIIIAEGRQIDWTGGSGYNCTGKTLRAS